jgi:hypothetical protein
MVGPLATATVFIGSSGPATEICKRGTAYYLTFDLINLLNNKLGPARWHPHRGLPCPRILTQPGETE